MATLGKRIKWSSGLPSIVYRQDPDMRFRFKWTVTQAIRLGQGVVLPITTLIVWAPTFPQKVA